MAIDLATGFSGPLPHPNRYAPLASLSPRAGEGARTSVPRGFTLIELLVVLAILGTLLTLAVPRYFSTVDKAKEAVLRENLAVMRDAIDKFYSDQGRYPAKLDDLVTQRYLRKLPLDPVTQSAATWMIVAPPASTGVYDVKSGAKGKTRDGTAYSEL